MPKKPSDVCIGCGKPKSPETFGSYLETRGRDAGKRKLWGRCLECTAAYHREYNARTSDKRRAQAAAGYRRAKERNPNLNRERDLRQSYGMTIAEYDAICESQNGVCAACKQPPTGGRWNPPRLVVDHCHRSGHVRQLLCHSCNRALGLVGDSIDRLWDLVDYLERNS